MKSNPIVPLAGALILAAAAASAAASSWPHAFSQGHGSGGTPASQTRGSDYLENFDSYVAGSQIIGQGGWDGWLGDPGAGALVDDTFSVSPDNSINIQGGTDIVQPFTGLDSGVYVVLAQQYIPSGFTGQSYFILQNTYPVAVNWSVQVQFDATSGQIVNDGSSLGTLPFVTDEWKEIRIEIDLDSDTQSFYYDNQLLYSGSWTGEVSGGGALEIASLNLFANGASPVYYDDIRVFGLPDDYEVEVSTDIDAGEALPGDSFLYTVTVTNAGLLNDVYDLDATGIWAATLSAPTLAVAAGTSETFTVEVEVPVSASPGDNDITTVTATSQGDPLVSASLELTTTAGDSIFANGFECMAGLPGC